MFSSLTLFTVKTINEIFTHGILLLFRMLQMETKFIIMWRNFSLKKNFNLLDFFYETFENFFLKCLIFMRRMHVQTYVIL